MPRLDAEVKNIQPFVGGNTKQRDHLNKLVSSANHHNNLIEEIDARTQRRPLQVVVANKNATRLSLIEIQQADHIADFGAFFKPKMHPWQPFIVDADIENGMASKAYINFNPNSTLWGEASSDWTAGGSQWDKAVSVVNFETELTTNDGPRMEVSTVLDAVWLEVVLGPYLSLTSATLRSGTRWGSFPNSYSGSVAAGGTIYHLLAYFRPKRANETADIIFQDGVESVMVATTTTDLLVGTVRQNVGSGFINDYPALIPWFKTYEVE